MIKQKVCEFEPETIKAFKSGFAVSEEEIAAHLQTCASCRETAKVVRFLQATFKEETAAPQFPAAGFLWWKSRIIERRRRATRAAQPIVAAQIAAAAALFATLAWLLASDSASTAPFRLAFASALASLQPFALPLAAAAVSFGILCLIFVLVLRRLLPEK